MATEKISSSLTADFIRKTKELYSLRQADYALKYVTFTEYFGTLTKEEKEFTQHHFLKKYFFSEPLINALCDSTTADHLPSTYLENMNWMRGEETYLFELIRREKEQEIRMFWIRLYLLRPYTRKSHAQYLLLCPMLADDTIAQELINSCLKQEKIYAPTRWQKFWNNY